LFPMLSDRRNIVVIADEAHRTQYGFEAKLKEVKVRGGQAPAALTTDGAAPTLTAGDFESPAYKTKYQVGYAQHLRDALP
ncbi:hypothetical protein ACXWOP_09680, partial [Streptococcus pyogenes]